ncbi:MAG: hypothetical protein JWO46_293 [Nocardioidaceae bacterium]|nr:hypothetical protein [Nocardioidaceae bacterium]
MTSDRSLLGLLDDLEQQASGLALVERDLEVEDRSRAEYARVTLASRLHALGGREVRLTLLGGLALAGEVGRTGPDWLLLVDAQRREWVVRHAAVAAVRGAASRAVADGALGVLHRLSLRSVLRGIGELGAGCVLHLVDGSRRDGQLVRLGQDFAEVRPDGAGPRSTERDLVPLASLAAVQRRDQA